MMECKKIMSKYNNGNYSYGIELIPKRTLNKLTDKLKIYQHKYINGLDRYSICFSRKHNGYTQKIIFKLNKSKFKQYIEFIRSFDIEYKESAFIVENYGSIKLKKLDKNYIKLACKTDNDTKVFYVLHVSELKSYLKILEKFYNPSEIIGYTNYYLSYDLESVLHPIKKCEKDKLYLNALYAFADCALDRKDKKLFFSISKEINKYKR